MKQENKGVENFGDVVARIITDAKRESSINRYSQEDNTYTVDPSGVAYVIDLSEIQKPEQMLGLILHLLDKTWITEKELSFFIFKVSDIKGWDIYC